MIKTILKEVKEYKAASIATPIYMILEVIFEMMIPLLMASIIDNGVNKGNMGHIYRTGTLMLVIAVVFQIILTKTNKIKAAVIAQEKA